ncbi:MAG: transcriptional repressor BetI [Roseibaca calidilacus]|uniref:HTH-type transcriptional regulator BetI n=2 Tax=Roseibaca calidilacus TaxID=1666912 RepID=A0A0P7VZ19_9RHOB|nr:transcriptional regulator BetI [Roseibaca calidilacus]KPP92760.1 MAG: transcriptional repressor BetI [Roseibaca calidilacus]CUX80167.1 transcriptional regulator, TetR family [Roseibaca calidilacus]
MPKVGMEPIRRDALIKAAIVEIGQAGSLDVTVSRIAKRAGMSSALAHHYFGSKEAMFLAAMRHVLSVYGAEIRGALVACDTPRDRLRALVRVSFTGSNFRREVVAAWLNFYVLAQRQDDAARLLRIYQARLRSNLRDALRPLVGPRAGVLADGAAAMIDGAYLFEALGTGEPDSTRVCEQVQVWLDAAIDGGHP